jgi:hypothetical protein
MPPPVRILIPVRYPDGPPNRVYVVADGVTDYQLIWEAAGAGVTFGDDPPNEEFTWKSPGQGEPAVTMSLDGRSLVSNVYPSGTAGVSWPYGLTIFRDGIPVTIDPVIENIPPGGGEGSGGGAGQPGGGQPGGGQPGGGQPGPPGRGKTRDEPAGGRRGRGQRARSGAAKRGR